MKRAIRTVGPLLLMAAAGVFATASYASAQDLSKDPSPPAQCTAKPKHKEKFLAQRAVAITPYPGCAPYTRAPYDVVFSEAVNLDCAYDLP